MAYLYPHCGSVCVVCETTSSQHCSRCKTKYCSIACQTTDWYFHRWLCKPLAERYRDRDRPTSNHHTVIIFPQHSTKPKLAWLNPDGTMVFEKFFNCPPGQIMRMHAAAFMAEIRKSSYEERLASREEIILISTNQTDQNNKLPCNMTVQTMGERLGWNYSWRGRLMLGHWDWKNEEHLAYNASDVPLSRFWRDVTYFDFRRAVDFLCWHRGNHAMSWPERFPLSVDYLIEAVKINCRQDAYSCQPILPLVESVAIRSKTTEIDPWTPLPATTRLGVPLLCRRVPCLAELRGQIAPRDRMVSMVNDIASFLMMEGPPDKDGNITLDRSVPIGPIVVIRADHGFIVEEHIRAMYAFLRTCVCDQSGAEAEAILEGKPIITFNAEKYYKDNNKRDFNVFWASRAGDMIGYREVPDSPYADSKFKR